MRRDFSDGRNLTALTDEELVVRCRKNEDLIHELISRYASVVRVKAKSFAGASSSDVEDLMQEGFIGLLSAVRTVKTEREISFSTYSNKCITNRMKSALSKNCRADGTGLSDDNEEQPDKDTPESIFFEKELSAEIDKVITHNLSEKEREIFLLFLQGETYEQMAAELDISVKTVDNALQRVRRKLKSVWKV